MKFTNEQKLIATMLAEIHQKLGITDGVNSKLVVEALWSDNEWAIQWEHGFLLDPEEAPPHVDHVVDTLDMWMFIESAYDELDDGEKKRFADEAYPYGAPRFEGFDGNNEGKHLSAARFLVEKMRRFEHFKGRGDLNSHSHTVERDRRMLSAFRPIRETLGMGKKRQLDVDDLIAIFKERIHPDNR